MRKTAFALACITIPGLALSVGAVLAQPVIFQDPHDQTADYAEGKAVAPNPNDKVPDDATAVKAGGAALKAHWSKTQYALISKTMYLVAERQQDVWEVYPVDNKGDTKVGPCPDHPTGSCLIVKTGPEAVLISATTGETIGFKPMPQ